MRKLNGMLKLEWQHLVTVIHTGFKFHFYHCNEIYYLCMCFNQYGSCNQPVYKAKFVYITFRMEKCCVQGCLTAMIQSYT